jgi:hypothetical protein
LAKKFLAKARAGMERRGTKGSLRRIAQKRGLISGKQDALTESDLAKLQAAAARMPEGSAQRTALMRKIQFARNAMKASSRRKAS